MIGFYGSGFDVAEKMNLLEALQAKSDQYQITKLSFVDRGGGPRATLDVGKFRELLHHRYFPLMCGDLASAIYESLKERVSIRFGMRITRLEVQPDGVTVELSDGRSEKYDLVIGAGGIHSGVRELLWRDESQFIRFLGFYVACSVIDDFFGTQGAYFGHFEPNVQATAYSISGNKSATFFLFRSARLNVHGRDEQMGFLAQRLGHFS
jgi:2-polyprenyl-6-methoxyphenol hydroxylase-like FAD-dependent oxidoreductase